MEDRYKFRGICIDNDEWVYGDLRNVENCQYILDYDIGDNGVSDIPRLFDIPYEVKPETLGQCTGLKDKNGVLIYEGDVVASCYVNLCGETFDEIDMDMVGIVAYEAGGFGIKRGLETLDMLCNYCNYSLKKEDYIPNYGVPVHYKNTCNMQVLGNTHENPELLNR